MRTHFDSQVFKKLRFPAYLFAVSMLMAIASAWAFTHDKPQKAVDGGEWELQQQAQEQGQQNQQPKQQVSVQEFREKFVGHKIEGIMYEDNSQWWEKYEEDGKYRTSYDTTFTGTWFLMDNNICLDDGVTTNCSGLLVSSNGVYEYCVASQGTFDCYAKVVRILPPEQEVAEQSDGGPGQMPVTEPAEAAKERKAAEELAETSEEQLVRVYKRGTALYQAGRYDEALPYFGEALFLGLKVLGPDHPTTAQLLNNNARLYQKLGQHTRAEQMMKQALAIREKALGPDHPELVNSLNSLASLYQDLARYTAAEQLYNRSLMIQETLFGANDASVAPILNNLATLYVEQGHYAAAEAPMKRALAIKEDTLGSGHLSVGTSLDNLATVYLKQGRYSEAEPLYERALAIRENGLGPDHSDVATTLNNLASLYVFQGRHAIALFTYERTLAIKEGILGADHIDVATVLNNISHLYDKLARYDEAESLIKRALAIIENTYGANHPLVATNLNNLASVYEKLARYGEAEPLYRRMLAIHEATLGTGHPDTARTLNNLATLYLQQGRFDDAEPLYERARKIYEQALGENHPLVANSLNNLALLFDHQGRYAAEEPLLKRALAIREKALGPVHSDIAINLLSLAGLYMKQDRYEAAEPLLTRALEINEKVHDAHHPRVAASLNGLAVLYGALDDHNAVELLLTRALDINETAFGENHPFVANSLNNLALAYVGQGRYEPALAAIRRATAIHRDRAGRAGEGRSGGGLSEQRSVRSLFVDHIGTLGLAVREDIVADDLGAAEGFEVSQLARASDTAGAVARMGARFAAGSDALAGLVRERQDAADRWAVLDKLLVDAASRPPDERVVEEESSLRADRDATDALLKKLDARLTADFPEYAELASPRPAALVDIQPLLSPGEALVVYTVGDDETYLWAVRRDRADMYVIEDLGAEALEAAVKDLRAGLDPTGIRFESADDIPPFNLLRAFQLYATLFAPAEASLEGARHVFVVPDGAMQSLPLGVLVTEQPQGAFTDFTGYAQIPWLARKYALTTLPSVSSLRALRTFAKTARASVPFTGFGDPALKGRPGGGSRGVELAGLYRGTDGIADVKQVSRLPRLPESAAELRALAAAVGGSEDQIYLRRKATETMVKSLDLSDSRILAFATHGLVGGELRGAAEPALVLTPPKVGTAEDDGLLTASEVATLKLNADLVILSACNTASGDGTPGAEGLSGLAKAFFYAGSRALLVSHWPVASDAAVRLTTGMLAETGADPTLGRAEALRRSMLAMLENPEKPFHAHPMFWAPFVVVGEGGVPAHN